MGLGERLIEALGSPSFPGGRGPERGSGGIYGLLVHNGVMYFTLAYEAKAYFVDPDGVRRIYGYELVGAPGPRSGGDSHNTSTAVDDWIYFGGWVHAPPLYRRQGGRRVIDFKRKFSHIHAYSISENRVYLLWQEGLNDPSHWAGEVSELVYDPLADRLLVARGDGHDRLGVYEAPARPSLGRPIRPLIPIRTLKGARFLDEACFTIHRGWSNTGGLVCIELGGNKYRIVEAPADYSQISADGSGVEYARSGWVSSLGVYLVSAVRGGLLSLHGDELWFHRLLDFPPSPYGPLKVNAAPVLGGILTAWNAYSCSTLAGAREMSGELQAASRSPPGPTVLVHIAPPIARIVAVAGVRVTSLAPAGGEVIVASNTWPGLERYDATRIDPGTKTLTVIPETLVASPRPPPLRFNIPGGWIAGRTWGGIPLYGYREARLILRGCSGGVLNVYTYDLATPPGGAEKDRYIVSPWEKASIDLAPHGWGIVSFKVEACKPERVEVILAP